MSTLEMKLWKCDACYVEDPEEYVTNGCYLHAIGNDTPHTANCPLHDWNCNFKPCTDYKLVKVEQESEAEWGDGIVDSTEAPEEPSELTAAYLLGSYDARKDLQHQLDELKARVEELEAI